MVGKLVVAFAELRFYHVNDLFEPLGEKYGVLATARLPKISLTNALASCFFFESLLHPMGFFPVVVGDARSR